VIDATRRAPIDRHWTTIDTSVIDPSVLLLEFWEVVASYGWSYADCRGRNYSRVWLVLASSLTLIIDGSPPRPNTRRLMDFPPGTTASR
jgi:hypothetical protein